ncbi:MAG: PEGA domain-containing protein [Gemmatimonadales bacterium]|nr:PEGA domain-containing protein [Gemmatimonadales bacterium]
MRRFPSAVALMSLVALGGCATLLASKSKEISLTTEPAGAEVLVNGNRVGLTPMRLKVEHGKSHTITFRKAGHRDMSCELTAKTGAGWVILDVLTGLVPIIIDAATGDWKQVKGDGCSVTLTPGS